MKPDQSSEKVPREFWIELAEFLPMIGDENGNLVPNGATYMDVSVNTRMNLVVDRPIENSIRVIEKRAYDALAAKLEKYRQALEFYSNMNPMDFKNDFIYYHHYNPFVIDSICGTKAREALGEGEK
jgi:hypothetical protein